MGLSQRRRERWRKNAEREKPSPEQRPLLRRKEERPLRESARERRPSERSVLVRLQKPMLRLPRPNLVPLLRKRPANRRRFSAKRSLMPFQRLLNSLNRSVLKNSRNLRPRSPRKRRETQLTTRRRPRPTKPRRRNSPRQLSRLSVR